MTAIQRLDHAAVRRVLRALAWRLAVLVAGGYLALLATPALASCSRSGQSAGSVTFSPPATIQLPANLSVGTVIWTSPQAVPGNSVTLYNCNNTVSGLENAKWGPPIGTDQTLFPTNYSWLSYRIAHPDDPTYLHAWPSEPVPDGSVQFSVGSALELVITGPVPTGNHSLAGGQLVQWDVDTGGGTKQTVELFNITTSNISLVPPTCLIMVDPTVVTLPTVSITAFTGSGTTTGQVPFNIRLNCQAYNHNLQITLATANHSGNNNLGVIAPSTGAGFAGQIGIQVLQGPSCTTPVRWNHAINEGHPPNGEWDLPFCAQYYQTSNRNVSTGAVTGTATYTLTYQ